MAKAVFGVAIVLHLSVISAELFVCCVSAVLSLLPRLRELLCHLLNSEELTSQLRTRWLKLVLCF